MDKRFYYEVMGGEDGGEYALYTPEMYKRAQEILFKKIQESEDHMKKHGGKLFSSCHTCINLTHAIKMARGIMEGYEGQKQ